MGDLEATIKRLEDSTEGSRELDAEIRRALGSTVRFGLASRDYQYLREVCPGFTGWETLPEYTTSIDAALTLVPEGYLVDLESTRTEQGDQFSWWVWRPEIADKNRSGPRRNRVITLCTAALKALRSRSLHTSGDGE